MKKMICMINIIVLLFTLAACGRQTKGRTQNMNQEKTVSDILAQADSEAQDTGDTAKEEAKEESKSPASVALDGDFDVDLTVLGSTIVYAEVYNMMMTPEDYVGKSVKMEGAFAVYEGEERNYYACIIEDATACCAQGIEFVLRENAVYPDDYPALGENITVTGIFDTYEEEGNSYCQLIHAEMES